MQLYCHGTKSPGLCEDDDLYDDFDMDEMDLNLENYDELFGVSVNHSEELFNNGGIDSLFRAKNMSRAQDVVAAEVFSSPFFLLKSVCIFLIFFSHCYAFVLNLSLYS